MKFSVILSEVQLLAFKNTRFESLVLRSNFSMHSSRLK